MPGNVEEGRGEEAVNQEQKFYENSNESRERRDDFFKWVPVFWVLGSVFFLYFVYVFFHCIPLLQPDEEDIVDIAVQQRAQVELMAINFFTLMILLCYAMAIVMHPGGIPENDPRWHYDYNEIQPVNLHERKKTGDRRHCKWCGKYKPDRCHHCRACGICILKMDHHCPWLYNCVGFGNYKPFVLVLVYAMFDCHLIVWTMARSVTDALTNVHTPITTMFTLLFAETVAVFYCILITLFLGFHIWLINQNMTTIEFCEKVLPKDGAKTNYEASLYSVGIWQNCTSVLGSNPFCWLLPFCPPEGDGCNYTKSPVAGDLYPKDPYGTYGYDSPRSSFAQLNADEYPSYKGLEENTPAYGGSIQPPARMFPPMGYHSGSAGYGDEEDSRPSDVASVS